MKSIFFALMVMIALHSKAYSETYYRCPIVGGTVVYFLDGMNGDTPIEVYKDEAFQKDSRVVVDDIYAISHKQMIMISFTDPTGGKNHWRQKYVKLAGMKVGKDRYVITSSGSNYATTTCTPVTKLP